MPQSPPSTQTLSFRRPRRKKLDHDRVGSGEDRARMIVAARTYEKGRCRVIGVHLEGDGNKTRRGRPSRSDLERVDGVVAAPAIDGRTIEQIHAAHRRAVEMAAVRRVD